MKETLKVGVSGVRGIVGESFTPQLATLFAKAFGTYVGGGTVLVGRDTRGSGAMFEYAVTAGLQAVGCKVLQLGVVPTPTLLYSVPRFGARGGIMITASHNPPEWNALKFVDRRGMFLAPIHAEELFDIYHQQEFPLVSESDLKSASPWTGAVNAHVDQVIGYVDAPAIRAAAHRVAVDCCNGVGALYSSDFLRRHLGCEVIAIHEEVTGEFARDPEPLAENISALCQTVLQHQCSVGFAQDPDGDRLAVVDEHGQPIGEEVTMALAVRGVLEWHGTGPVAVNLSSGKAVEWVTNKFKAPLTRTRTGEIYVSEAVKSLGAVVGGEHTGGIIVPAIHPSRDSFAGMAVILELLTKTGRTVSELVAEIPRFALMKEKIPISADQAPALLRKLRACYEGQPMNFLDGLYIDFGDRWVHVRRSNTEPVLRLIAESPTESETRALINEIRQRLGLS